MPRRLAVDSGAMELLHILVDFNPAKRPTLKQVMYHPVFSSFRSPSKEKEAPPDYVVSYYSSRHRSGRMILDVRAGKELDNLA